DGAELLVAAPSRLLAAVLLRPVRLGCTGLRFFWPGRRPGGFRLDLRLRFPFGFPLALAGALVLAATLGRPGLALLPDNLHLLLRIKPHDLPFTIQGHQRDLELAGVQPLLDLLGRPYRQVRVEALDLDHVANRQVLHRTRLVHSCSPNRVLPRLPDRDL